ncbi:hypothetical protein QBC38DRAFT_525097 [Podospora fimiseda]|uniref:Ecp2 effector protein domain-containing protein n=1 Tax=Podospora fimiseda TaxID=252190 RepID=A0AAN7BQZ4_9PEZI|nr:hypothetical protein QBC38DRAFT_525097 [Podospora fimiseda]
MHLFTQFLVVSFVALVSSSPLGNRAYGPQLCTNYTYENRGSLASPTVANCERLFEHLGYDWAAHKTYDVYDEQRALAWLRFVDCTVGGELIYESGLKERSDRPQLVDDVSSVGGGPKATIGVGDIRDVIRYSIDNFRWVGEDRVHRVGSRGYSLCPDNKGGMSTVMWGLYN